MPTTYAHWRFGNDCLKTLPQDLTSIVDNHRNIFDFGVQGPDIFFYYNALKPNEVNKYGSGIHKEPAKKIFQRFKDGYAKAKNKNEALSYILGFLCHFTLDSHCHSYIDRAAELTEFSHLRIESQYDKYLLEKDGYNPIKKKVTFSFHPSKKIAKTIATLYDKYNDKVVYRSIIDHVVYLNILKDNYDLKRYFILKIMEKAKAEAFKDLLITKNKFEGIEPIMLRIDKLYDKALKHYKELALNLINYINDKEELDDYFNNTFEYVEDYKSIPVLTLEEEKKYIVDKF